MINVTELLLKECTRKGIKSIIDKISNLNPLTITENAADILNTMLEGIGKVDVLDNGNISININLSALQLKFILKQIYKQL